MEDELLEIIEAMEANGESPEAIADFVASYEANTPVETPVETPAPQTVEKKNPDGTAFNSADGSSDSVWSAEDWKAYQEDAAQDKRDRFWKTSAKGGLARLNEMITSVPNTLYNIAAYPQNKLADALDLPEDHWLRADDESFEETIGVKNSILDHYQEEVKRNSEIKQEYIEENYESGSISDNISKGNYSDAFDLLGSGMIESAPISLGIMAGGGAFGLARTAIGTTVGLTESQKNELKQQFPDATEAELTEKAVMSAAAESVFASVSTGTLGSVYKDIIKKEGKKAGQEIFRKGIVEMYKKALKKYGAGAAALGEGIEESATQITQNMIAGRDPFEGVADAFILGTASGGAMGAPITVANQMQKFNQKKAPEGATQELNVEAEEQQEQGAPDPTAPEGFDSAGKTVDEILNEQFAAQNTEEETTQEETQTTEPQEDSNLPAEQTQVPARQDEVTTETQETQETEDPVEGGKKFVRVTNEAVEQAEAAQKSSRVNPLNSIKRLITTRRPEIEEFFSKIGLKGSRETMDAVAGHKAATALEVEKNNKIIDNLDDTQKTVELTDDKGNTTMHSERDIFDKVVKARAILGIQQRYESNPEKYPNLGTVTHMGGVTPVAAKGFLENLQETNPEAFNKAMDASFQYEMRFKDLLDESLNEGLISPQLHEDLRHNFYSPRKVLDYMIKAGEIEGQQRLDESKLERQVRGSLANFAKKIKDGTEQLDEMDAMLLMNLYTAGQQQRVFKNRSHRTFANEFKAAKENRDNMTPRQQKAFDRFNQNVVLDQHYFDENGKLQYRVNAKSMEQAGFLPIHYYENGIRKRLFMEQSLHEQFTDTMSKMPLHPVVRWITGSTPVKLMATGFNMAFMFANIPMEFVHAMNVSPVYSDFLLRGGSQLAKDYVGGMSSSMKKDKTYETFIKNGGGQLFKTLEARRIIAKKNALKTLSAQVKDKTKNTLLKKGIDKVWQIQQATEEGIRIAIFKRSVKNQVEAYLKGANLPVKRGESGVPASKMKEIYSEAVARSREVADFNRGSVAMKSIEGVIPYANITAQATDALLKAYKERPLNTVMRQTQTAVATTSFFGFLGYALVSMFNDDDELSTEDVMIKSINQQSRYTQDKYWIIPTGIKKESGNYVVIPIRKVETVGFFTNLLEEMMIRSLAAKSNIEYIERDMGELALTSGMENYLPIPVKPKAGSVSVADNLSKLGSSIPMVSAMLAAHNINAYTGKPLSYERVPEHLEGRSSDRIEPFMKQLSDFTNDSPVRLQKMLESYITTPNTNPFVGMGYEALNLTLGNQYNDKGEVKDILGAMGEGFKRRLMKEGFEYNALSKLDTEPTREDIEKDKALLDFTNIVKGEYIKHIEEGDKVPLAVTEANITAAMEDYLEAVPEMSRELATKHVKKVTKKMSNKKAYQPIIYKVMFGYSDRSRASELIKYFGDGLSEDNIEAFRSHEHNKEIWKELNDSGAVNKEVMELYNRMLKIQGED